MTHTTDRQLLELAAKAAGIVVLGYVENYDDFYWHGPSWGLIIEGANGVWNPLEDDGDALRLVVKLGLSVDVVVREGDKHRSISANGDVSICGHVPHNGDPYAATRRAIVCAAAAIAIAKAGGES